MTTQQSDLTIDLSKPWQVLETTADDFLVAMALVGKYQDINLVGSFADPDDQTARTAHRDKDLPWHRDGIESQAIKDMQGGMYIEKPNVDVVGMFCLRDNRTASIVGRCAACGADSIHVAGCSEARTPCYTILAEAAPDADPYDDSQFEVVAEVDLRPGQALIWDNRLWHGRRGNVGNRMLIRFWTTCPALYEARP